MGSVFVLPGEMNEDSPVTSYHSSDDIIASTFATSSYTPMSLPATLSGFAESIIIINPEERGARQSN